MILYNVFNMCIHTETSEGKELKVRQFKKKRVERKTPLTRNIVDNYNRVYDEGTFNRDNRSRVMRIVFVHSKTILC